MGRQPFSTYFPQSRNIVFDQTELDADDPAVDPRGLSERLGGSFIDVQLNNAEILDLANTPIQLIAAPGALRAIVVDAIFMFWDLAGTDYTETDDELTLIYAGGADSSAGFEMNSTGVVDNGDASSIAQYYGNPFNYVAGAALVVTPIVNVAVQLNNDDANFGAGDVLNTLSVRIWYHIVDMAAFT